MNSRVWNGRDLNPIRGFENGHRPFRQNELRFCPEGVKGHRPVDFHIHCKGFCQEKICERPVAVRNCFRVQEPFSWGGEFVK